MKFEDFNRLVEREIKQIKKLISQGSYLQAEDMVQKSILLSQQQKDKLLKEIKELKESQRIEKIIEQNNELKKHLLALLEENIELKAVVKNLEDKVNKLENKLEKIDNRIEEDSSKSVKWTLFGNIIGVISLITTLAPLLKASLALILDALSELLDKAIQILNNFGSK